MAADECRALSGDYMGVLPSLSFLGPGRMGKGMGLVGSRWDATASSAMRCGLRI